MLRWLSRLFGRRDEAETAPAAAPPLATSPLATPPPAAVESRAGAADAQFAPPPPLASTGGPAAEGAEAVETADVMELPEVTAEVEGKETCPTCGRTSVFAGPPGQRFCTYCALRDELFERSAAATE